MIRDPAGPRLQTPAERATQIVWRAAVSESNRRVKMASRPDAAQRIEAAERKRYVRRMRNLDK